MDKPVNQTLKEMIVERLFLNITPDEVPDDANLMQTLGIDSVQIFEIVVGCEEVFGITFEEGDFDITAFQTVNAIAEVVRNKLGPGGTS
jgi:acyl carrier protein